MSIDYEAIREMQRELDQSRGMSATQRLTHKRRLLLAAGVHPTTKLNLANNGETCGSCAHHFSHSRRNTYHKCDLVAFTHGPGSDIRLSWPACIKWAALTVTAEEESA